MYINSKIGDKGRNPCWLITMEIVWQNNHRYQSSNYIVANPKENKQTKEKDVIIMKNIALSENHESLWFF